MSNNTSIDPIEHKSVKVKTGNMCKVRNHLTNLYKKYGIVAEAINLIIGEDDDTPTIIDNLSETIEKVRNIDGVEVSHLGGNHITLPFTFSDSFVRLNWDCYNLGESNEPTSHYAPIPVASTTNAGIITSDDKRLITGLSSQSYSLIYRNNGPVGKRDTWVSDATDVYLQFDQYGPTNGTIDHHTHPGSALPFPKASSSSAGIISAEMYRNLNNWFSKDLCSENKINTYEEVLDFLDGVEGTYSQRDIYLFDGHLSTEDFAIESTSNYTAITQKDRIFWCNESIYVVDGEILNYAHFYDSRGNELTLREPEPIVFLIIYQEGLSPFNFLNEVGGEPVSTVKFKTSSSSNIEWEFSDVRLRISLATTGGLIGLSDANLFLSKNLTIKIGKRANFPIPLLSRFTGITNRLTTVELTSTNLGNDKVNITETVPYGLGNIKTTIYRDANAALDIKLEYRKRLNDNTNLGLVDIRDLVIISTEDSSNDLTSCITVLPASITLDGGDVTIKGENDVNICSQSGQTSNASITVSESTGLYELYLNPTDHITSLINLGDNALISSGIVNSSVAQIGLGIDEINSNKPLVNAEVTTYSNNVATTLGLQINSDESKLYNSNISVTLNNSTGLKIDFSDGSKILYGIDGTKYEIYNLPLMENYFETHILRGYYGVDQDTNKSELTINLPFDILDTVTSINSIIPNESFSFIGITSNFERFKIYKSNISDVTHYYFLMENNSPLEIDEMVLGGHHIRNIIYLRHNNI